MEDKKSYLDDELDTVKLDLKHVGDIVSDLEDVKKLEKRLDKHEDERW